MWITLISRFCCAQLPLWKLSNGKSFCEIAKNSHECPIVKGSLCLPKKKTSKETFKTFRSRTKSMKKLQWKVSSSLHSLCGSHWDFGIGCRRSHCNIPGQILHVLLDENFLWLVAVFIEQDCELGCTHGCDLLTQVPGQKSEAACAVRLLCRAVLARLPPEALAL